MVEDHVWVVRQVGEVEKPAVGVGKREGEERSDAVVEEQPTALMTCADISGCTRARERAEESWKAGKLGLTTWLLLVARDL